MEAGALVENATVHVDVCSALRARMAEWIAAAAAEDDATAAAAAGDDDTPLEADEKDAEGATPLFHYPHYLQNYDDDDFDDDDDDNAVDTFFEQYDVDGWYTKLTNYRTGEISRRGTKARPREADRKHMRRRKRGFTAARDAGDEQVNRRRAVFARWLERDRSRDTKAQAATATFVPLARSAPAYNYSYTAPAPVPVTLQPFTLRQPPSNADRLTRLLAELQTREITPEDYDLLLQLDESVPKKTAGDNFTAKIEVETVTEVSNEDKCLVCHDEYELGDKVKTLPQCGHRFHAECIDEWLGKSSDKCPIDNLPVAPA